MCGCMHMFVCNFTSAKSQSLLSSLLARFRLCSLVRLWVVVGPGGCESPEAPIHSIPALVDDVSFPPFSERNSNLYLLDHRFEMKEASSLLQQNASELLYRWAAGQMTKVCLSAKRLNSFPSKDFDVPVDGLSHPLPCVFLSGCILFFQFPCF